MHTPVVVTLLSLCLFSATIGYKPVVLLHGILTASDSMMLIKQRLEELHPGTIVYNIDKFAGWSSLDNMWHQVLELGADLMNITRQHPNGIHFLGYSQGAILSRVILQAFPEHNVHNYVSLSGPQAGQYGTAFLHLIFPNLALKTAFELFYSRLGQHTSVGNYWNDPYHQYLYYNFSQFLPYVNNELKCNRSEEFKKGIVKLKKMILIGGPHDGIIGPWESSQFGYYNHNGSVISMKKRDIYLQDRIGLKHLNERSRLVLITVPNVTHFMWHTEQDIVDNYIVPHFN